MRISEFAKRAGVTVKTLLYYDKIGLLKPSQKSDSGYRIYSEKDFLKLQQITTLKFIGLSLKEINKILSEAGENLESIIYIQKKALEEKKKHLESVITVFNKAENQIKGNGFLEVEQLIDIIRITNMENKVKERFDNASKQYITDRLYWRIKSAELINELIKPNDTDVVLDLGCGTGKQIIKISQKVKLAIGLDISDGMVNEARENAKQENCKNVEFYIGTFEHPDINIDLGKKSITKIISNYALHHLDTRYKRKAIEKMISSAGESLQSITIGDLMFFEKPDKYKAEYDSVGYGPTVDRPSTVEEMIDCFSKFDFDVEVHKLHPLVGILVANKKSK
ncbi:MerR family transcriptional regulator [Clostridium sp. PL3]|uniref:MerR family transcriptional regulator n=1 Tax=Clostridium thailandense TaxID=2794346 RepID=A0A949TLV6_9CLOT|nr:MerR family transcriptional regulator [Clostridium thailandense]MBV7274740.1 MerR family transcriptional regulator [Clostridium thailandense]